MQLEIILLAALLLMSAFFSGIETAFVALTDIKVNYMISANKKNAKTIAELKKRPKRLIATILVGNNIVNIALSAITTKLALALFGSSGVAIAIGALTFTILIFGEITPKSLAIRYCDRLAQIAARPLQIISFLLFPVVFFFEKITDLIFYFTGTEERGQTVTEEELRTMISMGAKENVIERKEKEFIEGVLEFNDITAREVMTPRVNMFALDADMKIKDALPDINDYEYSRIPIYKKTIDKIIGVVHIKDVLKAIEKGKTSNRLKSIASEPVFVAENRIISEIFKEMQKKRTHIAIIVDEYGGTEGMLTLEDLLEEIVGEIMDETDLSPKMILRVGKNTIIVHGDTEVDEVNHFFNCTIPTDESYNTINGLFHHELKRIPKKDARIVSDGVTLIAQEVSKKKVLKVKIVKNK